MPHVTITLSDTPTGGVSIKTDFAPAVGHPISVAQSAALDILRRTRREYGLAQQVDTDLPPPNVHLVAAVGVSNL